MGAWLRRLANTARLRGSALMMFNPHPQAPERFGFGLLSRLHSVRHASQNRCLELDLVPGVTARDIRAQSFVNVDATYEERSKYIGYTVVGKLEVDKPLRVQYQDAFVVCQIGSKQFKITTGDVLYIERLKFADINAQLVLHRVLLLGTKTETVIGRPLVPGVTVSAVVEEHALDGKVIIFKKKRRKNYRRHRGHRQMLTRIMITRINGIDTYISKDLPSEPKDTTVAAITA